jgi:acyl carrier protein
MNNSEIRNLILKHLHQIAPEIDLGTLNESTDMRPQLDIDSMDFYRLLVALSEELKVEIPEEEYSRLTTMENLMGFLSKRNEK